MPGLEWSADFQNFTDKPVTIKHGDKLCQAVFFSLLSVVWWEEVDEMNNPNRGGYGTTHDNAAERESK
jgi:dUTPase